jgi:hypothetical protein
MSNPVNTVQKYPVMQPDQPLFTTVQPSPVHWLFQFLSGWLFKIYKIKMEDTMYYVSDIGFNQRLYFHKHDAHTSNKHFWRINTLEPFERTVSVPMVFRFPVSAKTHNFHDDGLNTFDFRYSLIIVIPNNYTVARLLSLERQQPLKTIEEAVQLAARTVTGHLPHKQLFISSSEITEAIKQAVAGDPNIIEIGIKIKEISCAFLAGNQDIFDLMKTIYRAKSLSQISDMEWHRYLQAAVPAEALQEETKRREHTINALALLGLPISPNELQTKVAELERTNFANNPAIHRDYETRN